MRYIDLEVKGFTGVVTLNNDKKHNSLNLKMLSEIESAFGVLKKEAVRSVIIKSNEGAKVWCAGLRIDELPDPSKDPVPFEYPLESTLRTIEQFPGAVIAMIEGSVWGGGCELAFSCDILIGSPKASFAITPAKLNAPYNPVQVQRVLSLVETNIAKELFFTAEPISAHRALELGILNHVIEASDLLRFTEEMAGKINRNAPQSIALIKKEIGAIGKGQLVSVENNDEIRNQIEKMYYSDDFSEGKRAFLEKRAPKFKGM